MQRKKKPKNYGRNKKAFDSVFSHYRTLGGLSTIRAVNLAGARGGSPNPAKPTPIEFRCDVETCIKEIVPSKFQKRFYQAYIAVECHTDIEQEMFADRMLGGIRHSFEQRLGELFIRKQVYPVQGHGYFYSIRKGGTERSELRKNI